MNKASIHLKNRAIEEINSILGISKSDTFYDLKMTPAERGVLIRAAGLPDDAFHRERKFNQWSDTAKNQLRKAASNAQQWANGLEFV